MVVGVPGGHGSTRGTGVLALYGRVDDFVVTAVPVDETISTLTCLAAPPSQLDGMPRRTIAGW